LLLSIHRLVDTVHKLFGSFANWSFPMGSCHGSSLERLYKNDLECLECTSPRRSQWSLKWCVLPDDLRTRVDTERGSGGVETHINCRMH
jgi:hypothetical protein